MKNEYWNYYCELQNKEIAAGACASSEKCLNSSAEEETIDYVAKIYARGPAREETGKTIKKSPQILGLYTKATTYCRA